MNDSCSMERNECDFRKRALRDAVLFIGWFKIMSVACYISMYYLIRFNAEGEFVFVLEICLLSAMVPAVLQGILLCAGAYTENSSTICAGLCCCVFLATYDLIIGVLGAAFIMIIADNVYHFVMTLAFVLLALTCIPAYCHDALIINSYGKVLQDHGCCN